MTPLQFKEARRSLGLSQSRLATVLGMGADGGRTIRRWENGERPPNPIACRAVQWMLDGYRPREMAAWEIVDWKR